MLIFRSIYYLCTIMAKEYFKHYVWLLHTTVKGITPMKN